MKILFKNTTKYNKENRQNFKNFHENKYGMREFIKGILIAMAVIYILMFNLDRLNWKSLLILVPLLLLFYLISKHMAQKKKENTNKQKNKEFTFFFYETYIKVKHRRQFERIMYWEVKKIFETDENFFLYTDETHSLILDKDRFSIGTAKEFAEFIKRKCPFKYSNK